MVAACSGDDGGGGATATASGTTSTTTATTTKSSVCADDPRATAYADGLSATSQDGAVTARLLSADPEPPAKGDNALVLAIEDAQGAPVAGAAVAVTPFMPDHGHGASTTPVVTESATPGTYDVKAVDLFMPGIWELRLRVTPAGGAAHDVVFTFCVDG